MRVRRAIGDLQTLVDFGCGVKDLKLAGLKLGEHLALHALVNFHRRSRQIDLDDVDHGLAYVHVVFHVNRQRHVIK